MVTNIHVYKDSFGLYILLNLVMFIDYFGFGFEIVGWKLNDTSDLENTGFWKSSLIYFAYWIHAAAGEWRFLKFKWYLLFQIPIPGPVTASKYF